MHPILFKIGPFELYTYGAFLAMAFLDAIYLATRAAEREGLSADLIAALGIVVILSAIVGSRAFYILFYDLQYTLQHPDELLRVRQTGLVLADDRQAASHRGDADLVQQQQQWIRHF